MGRSAPDQLEGVGGLFLAVIQLGITMGALAGGLALDSFGTSAPLYLTATSAILAAALILTQQAPNPAEQVPTKAVAE
jgi:MFS transporter, DHA1 family, purine ribonucleoside efflux pump